MFGMSFPVSAWIPKMLFVSSCQWIFDLLLVMKNWLLTNSGTFK